MLARFASLLAVDQEGPEQQAAAEQLTALRAALAQVRIRAPSVRLAEADKNQQYTSQHCSFM